MEQPMRVSKAYQQQRMQSKGKRESKLFEKLYRGGTRTYSATAISMVSVLLQIIDSGFCKPTILYLTAQRRPDYSLLVSNACWRHIISHFLIVSLLISLRCAGELSEFKYIAF